MKSHSRLKCGSPFLLVRETLFATFIAFYRFVRSEGRALSSLIYRHIGGEILQAHLGSGIRLSVDGRARVETLLPTGSL